MGAMVPHANAGAPFLEASGEVLRPINRINNDEQSIVQTLSGQDALFRQQDGIR